MSTHRPNRKPALGAALVGAALLPLLPALSGPALATSATSFAGGSTARPSVAVVTDVRRDVARLTDSGDAAAPARRQGDITRIRVLHGEDVVRIGVRFAELGPVRGSALVTLTVRTPGREFATGLTVDPSTPQGVPWIEEGGDFACPGLTSRVRYGRDLAVVRVPRACLGDPAWVRVGGSVITGGQRATYADSAPGRSLSTDRVGPRAWDPAS